MMLEFEEEENSGHLVAHSETTPFKTYWIDEGVWVYLQSVQGDRAGATYSDKITFNSVDDAVAEANKIDAGQGGDQAI
jgi:ABC-type transport system substrate-binding protein